MKKFKKAALTAASYVSVAALAIGGTLAYLTDTESNKNTMTMGKVDIEQHEYQRVVEADGAYKTDDINENGTIYKSYLLEEFVQDKKILPIVGDPNEPGTSDEYAGYDAIPVRMSQVGSYGSSSVFAGKNAQDKFVTVENTGKSDAFVRTLIAIEIGSTDGTLIGTESRGVAVEKADESTQPWLVNEIGAVDIDGSTYNILEYTYRGAADVGRHINGVLPAGETTYPNLCQVYLKHNTTNDDIEAIDGNGNGKLDILVVSQAVQTDGFENAKTALDKAFGETTATNHPWATTTDVTDKDSALAAFKTGGNVALSGDIDLNPDTGVEPTGNIIADDTVLDMDGNAITYGVEYVSGMNGTQISALTVDKDADLTIIDGNVKATSAYGIYVKDGNCVINGGSYTGGTSAIQVYNGTLQITSGKFEVTEENNTYLINCIDGNYKDGSAKVIITGGSFKEWNPADNAAEGVGTNFVAPGYKVVEEEIDGATWYTVVAE